MLTEQRKKQLDADIWIIAIVSLLILEIYIVFGSQINAIMCILIHGAIGITPEAIIEMLTTMFLIYGMLLVKKHTGNAWGCVLIFVLYWNAL